MVICVCPRPPAPLISFRLDLPQLFGVQAAIALNSLRSPPLTLESELFDMRRGSRTAIGLVVVDGTTTAYGLALSLSLSLSALSPSAPPSLVPPSFPSLSLPSSLLQSPSHQRFQRAPLQIASCCSDNDVMHPRHTSNAGPPAATSSDMG